MNWVKEKNNHTVIALFLISALVGGFAIGILDANRPNPLFSSADEGGSILETCNDEVSNLEAFIDSLPNPIPSAQITNYYNQSRPYLNQVITCAQTDQAHFDTDWNQRKTAAENEAWAEFLPGYQQAGAEVERTDQLVTQRAVEWVAARDAYNDCIFHTTNKGSSAQKGAAPLPLKENGLVRTNDYTDCEELHQAYLDADAASNEAMQENLAALEAVRELDSEWQDTTHAIDARFDEIREIYEEDNSYTVEYATDYADTPFGNFDPNYSGYYNNRGERAY